MSIKSRSLVFGTFFGNCLIVGFLIASFTTEYWIEANGRRHNSSQSQGVVNFGLFSGSKDLNVGYGQRAHKINVVSFIKSEPDVMSYWLWLGAALGTGFGLFSSAIASVAAILKSASGDKKGGTMILLFISNFASAISQMLAFICWIVQFYEYLTHNVFAIDDRENLWYSKGLANFGHSFYFVVVGCILSCINVILLIIAVNHEQSIRRRHVPDCDDEKTQGAIMLY